MAYDLLHYLGVNLQYAVRDLCSEEPESTPGWWLGLITQLPDNGAFAASVAFTSPQAEGPSEPSARDWRGWGQDRQLLAAIYDAINANTAATGQFKRKPRLHPWPRPGMERHVRTVSLDEALPA